MTLKEIGNLVALQANLVFQLRARLQTKCSALLLLAYYYYNNYDKDKTTQNDTKLLSVILYLWNRPDLELAGGRSLVPVLMTTMERWGMICC